MAGKVGRPKGSGRGQHAARILKGVTEQSLTRIAELFDNNPNMLTPLEFFIGIYTDNTLDHKTRMAAAERCMPYVHSRLPEQVEHTGKDGGPIETANRMLLINKIFPSIAAAEGQRYLANNPHLDAVEVETTVVETALDPSES
jgi:hypothetical protein